MRHESDGDTRCSWCTWNCPQRLGKKLKELYQQTNRNHPDHSTVKINKDTEKSPGDLRRLAVTI